jgi:hypothetical protein
MSHLNGLDEYEAEYRKAQEDEAGGMAAIAYPLAAIAAVALFAWLATVLPGWM